MSNHLRLMFGEAWIYGLTLVIGVLMVVQGYGSAITGTLWNLDWGLFHRAEWHVILPDGSPLLLGTPFLLGTLGCVFVFTACFAVKHE